MWRPGTPEAEGYVLVDLGRRSIDGRFELIEPGAWHERCEIRDLLLIANQQRDKFGARGADDSHDLSGSAQTKTGLAGLASPPRAASTRAMAIEARRVG